MLCGCGVLICKHEVLSDKLLTACYVLELMSEAAFLDYDLGGYNGSVVDKRGWGPKRGWGHTDYSKFNEIN